MWDSHKKRSGNVGLGPLLPDPVPSLQHLTMDSHHYRLYIYQSIDKSIENVKYNGKITKRVTHLENYVHFHGSFASHSYSYMYVCYIV